MSNPEQVLIVGAGDGLSASLARTLHAQGMRVALAARDTGKLAALAATTDALTIECDAAQPAQVTSMFERTDAEMGALDLVVYNPSARVRGPVTEIDAEAVRQALLVTCYGAFLVAQAAASRMLPRGHGAIFFTGATAGVKGFANSASFAMGKFGLRGLAQSMARELAPKGIHVAHFVIDGGIRAADKPSTGDNMLDPDAIAQSYLDVYRQHRSAWAWELELRPWVERF